MNRRALFSMLALVISGLLVTGNISLAPQAQPVQASGQSTTAAVSGWQQVNSDGFGDGSNVEIRRLAVYNGQLFASTVNGNTGGAVWRSANGTTWEQVSLGGFGSISNTVAHVETDFDGHLYVGTDNHPEGAEIWRCTTCDGSDWTSVVNQGFDDPNNHTVQRVMVFSDTLYATVDNNITGVEIWKSLTGNAGSWVQGNTDGFGNPQNTGAWAAAVFDEYLYVATAVAGDWALPDAFGVEVWRTDGDDNWVKVTPEGFGGRENAPWDLTKAGGKLYLSLANFDGVHIWRCVTCDGSDWEQVIDGDFGTNAFATVIFEYQNQLIAATTNNWTLELSIELNGIDVWKSADGIHWTRISNLGFGDPYNSRVGAGAITEYRGLLYLGTQNWETGAELWRLLKQVYLPLVIRQTS